MPTFQIGLDDGRTLHIDADNQEAALSGAQHFMQHGNSGFVADAKQGTANLIGGVGETLNQYGAPGLGGKLKNVAKGIAPEGYQEPNVVSDDGGVSPGNLPHAVAEAAPGFIPSIAAAKFMPGGPIAKLLAGSAVYALQTLGNKAKARAVNNTGDENAVPTTADKAAAVAGVIPEAAIGAVGLNRFLPGAAVKGVGAAGIANAVKRLATTAAVEGATGAAQNATSQATNTLGTTKGLNVNLPEVENAGVVNAATGGAVATPKTIGDVGGAVKYRKFGGSDADAVASVANDIQNKAGGVDNITPSFFKSRAGAGYDAVRRAQEENTIELKRQLANSNVTLPADAQHAMDRALKGEHLSEADHASVTSAVNGTPNGDLISFLARKAGVFPALKSLGAYNEKLQNFTGGPSGRFLNLVREHIGKTALATAFAGAEGGHLIAYSPAMLAAAGVAGLSARAIDSMNGNLNPAGRFVKKFANPAVQAPLVNAPPTAPVSYPPATGPKVSASPGGVMQTTGLGPWGQAPAAGATPNPQQGQIADVQQLMAARRANAKLMQNQATPLLKKLAKSEATKFAAEFAGSMVGGHLAGEVGGHFGATLAGHMVDKLAADKPEAQGLPAVQPAAEIPSTVPKEVMARMKSYVRSLQAMQAMKQRMQGQEYANTVAASSPLVASVGGPGVVANPAAGQRMSQMVSAVNAMKKLSANASGAVVGRGPNGNAQPAEPVTPRTVVKTNGKVHEDNEPFPKSSYAHLPAEEAAKQITQATQAGGALKYASNFRASTLRRLQGERSAMDLIGREVPGLPVKEIAARLEGVSDQKTAKAFREHMKKQFPNAAQQFDQYLSNTVIESLWRHKG